VLDRLKNGDNGAFNALVDQYKNKIMRICFRFLKNREDVEDAVQETFIEIYKSISEFRSESLLSTWIYRIAVTKSLDCRRKKQRMKRLVVIKSFFGIDENEEIPEVIPSNPEIRLENSERV
jgi:RNA polymerase sigma-70 factor, ECF subfamily